MEIFKMENTTKTGAFNLTKTKAARGAALVLFTLIISHAPVMGGCFPAAAALVAYMVYRNPVNLYLALPAAAGILPYFARGGDPWGDLAAAVVCGVLMAAAGKIKLKLWHAALMAASAGIVCISISRLATVTVYKLSPEKLIMYGVIIFALMFVFDTMHGICENRGAGGSGRITAKELPLISLTTVCMLFADGINAAFLSWPLILFLALLVLVYVDAGQALLTVTAGGVWAALIGQAQWGLMATAAIGIAAALFAKKLGGYACGAVFIFMCWVLGTVESGLVLGADSYCLMLAGASFAALNWKFGRKFQALLMRFSGKEGTVKEAAVRNVQTVLRSEAAEMADLSELYSTYLDSRSVLAKQFDITRQIMDNVRRNMDRSLRGAALMARERFDVDIAVSQWAAAGDINGDCCGWQEIGDGKVVMVVSDGMGKGKKAAAESLMVTKTIISLLKAGVTADLTLKMINAVMLMKDDEDSYATVDLAIVDKRSGRAKFYKIGAAPTLIRRQERVEELKLSAVPLGIVNGLKIRYMETTLKKDDWVIMMSDGVSDGGDAGARSDSFMPVLKDAASKVRSSDPRTMSAMLMNRAADSYIGRERDDLTVMVAKII